MEHLLHITIWIRYFNCIGSQKHGTGYFNAHDLYTSWIRFF